MQLFQETMKPQYDMKPTRPHYMEPMKPQYMKPEMVCLFDLGEMLSSSNGKVLKLTDKAINTCIQKGYQIGVITPPGKVAALVVDFLHMSGMGKKVANALIESEGFQVTSHNNRALKNIVSFYQIDPKCVIVFDSGLDDSKYTKISDYKMALQMVEKTCTVTPSMHSSDSRTSSRTSVQSKLGDGSSGLCIFDFDGTLHIGSGKTAPQAIKAIQQCLQRGLQIGVVTSSDAERFLHKFLQKLVPSVFTSDFLSSNAFQPGKGNKVEKIRRMMNFFGVDRQCVGYVDDAAAPIGKAAGIPYVVVKPKNGVTSSDMEQLLDQMPEQCFDFKSSADPRMNYMDMHTKMGSQMGKNSMMEFEVDQPGTMKMGKTDMDSTSMQTMKRGERSSKTPKLSEDEMMELMEMMKKMHPGYDGMSDEPERKSSNTPWMPKKGYKGSTDRYSKESSAMQWQTHKSESGRMDSSESKYDQSETKYDQSAKYGQSETKYGQFEQKAPLSGVCIFNFDGTLHIGRGKMAPEGGMAVQRCADDGFEIGVVSSSKAKDFMKKALSTLLPEVFNDEMLNSDAFQAGDEKDKTTMIKDVLEFYRCPSNKAVYFDDAPGPSKAIGVLGKFVNPKTGIRQSDVLSTLPELHGEIKMGRSSRSYSHHRSLLERDFMSRVMRMERSKTILDRPVQDYPAKVLGKSVMDRYHMDSMDSMDRNKPHYRTTKSQFSVMRVQSSKAILDRAAEDYSSKIYGDEPMDTTNDSTDDLGSMARFRAMKSQMKSQQSDMRLERSNAMLNRAAEDYPSKIYGDEPMMDTNKDFTDVLGTMVRYKAMKKDFRSIQSADPHSGQGLCIFNFDGPLHIGGGKMAREAVPALKYCMEQGFQIAIVSSAHAVKFLHRALSKLMPNLFTEEFFQSNAFQAAQKDKAAMIKKAMAFYSVNPECVVYFDDAPKSGAEGAGVTPVFVDPSVGILQSKVMEGLSKLAGQCPMHHMPRNRMPAMSMGGMDGAGMDGMDTFKKYRIPEYQSRAFQKPALKHPPFESKYGWKRKGPRGKVCIFDFDGVILVDKYSWTISPYFQQALTACLGANMDIGVIADSHSRDIVRKVLSQINSEVFNVDFFFTPSFQHATQMREDKAEALERIIDWHSAVPGCSVFFNNAHEEEANYVGINFQKVNQAVGLTKNDFNQAWEKMAMQCGSDRFDQDTHREADYGVPPMPLSTTYEETSSPKCVNLHFGEGTIPQHCTDFKHNEICEMKCDMGYVAVDGQEAVQCVHGIWSGPPLKCKHQTSSVVDERLERMMTTRQDMYTRPNMMSMSGPNMMSPRTERMGASMEMSEMGARSNHGVTALTFDMCPNLYLPDEWNALPSKCENRRVGEVCTFECKPGFMPTSGSGKIMCLAGKRWSHPPLQCVPFSSDITPFAGMPTTPSSLSASACPNLHFPVGVVPRGCVNMRHGDVCRLQCDAKFQPSGGDQILTCVNGKWSGAPLSCAYSNAVVSSTTEFSPYSPQFWQNGFPSAGNVEAKQQLTDSLSPRYSSEQLTNSFSPRYSSEQLPNSLSPRYNSAQLSNYLSPRYSSEQLLTNPSARYSSAQHSALPSHYVEYPQSIEPDVNTGYYL